MYIRKFLGRQLCFNNGLSVGFHWVHCNGESSKRSAVIAAYHPPRSITWIWSLCWNKPVKFFRIPRIVHRWYGTNGAGSVTLALPLVGGFTWNWQKEMPRAIN